MNRDLALTKIVPEILNRPIVKIDNAKEPGLLQSALVYKKVEELLVGVEKANGRQEEFLREYEEAIRLRILRTLNDLPNTGTDFGEFEHLVKKIERDLLCSPELLSFQNDALSLAQVKKVLGSMTKALSENGVGWLPEEHKRAGAVASGVIMPMSALGYSLRVGAVTLGGAYDIPTDVFTSFILYGAYFGMLLMAHQKECGVLQEGGKIVCSPYVTLLNLAIPTNVASIIVRSIEFIATSLVAIPFLYTKIAGQPVTELYSETAIGYMTVATFLLIVDYFINNAIQLRQSKEG